MKLSASDEYGIRILLRIARVGKDEGLTTADLASLEDISMSHAGKILRLLRQGGFVESTRGNRGGYMLTRKPEEINIGKVIDALGGRLFDASFCESISVGEKLCTNSVDCSVRSLWSMVQYNVDVLLAKVSLADLIGSEEDSALRLSGKTIAL